MEKIKTRVIAEIGNSHEGSLGIALSLIDMAAKAGADLVKFQFHLSDFESTTFEPFRVNRFKQDKTRLDYWKRVGFTVDQWKMLKKHCDSKKVEFLCSPFSIEAAEVLHRNMLIKRWKIGSGEISNYQLLDYVFNTNMEVLVSTGLSDYNDINRLITYVRKNNYVDQLVLMHCVSQYPTPIKNSSLNLINEFSKSYRVKVGHSDHSGNISTSIFALTFPIEYLEVHISPHALFFGPDTSSSLIPEEFRQLIKFRNDFSIIKKSSYSRDELFKMSKKTANIFRKSLYWSLDLKAGSKITKSHMIVRKPWSEIDASEFQDLLGKEVKRNVVKGSPIRKKDIK